jgi:hypothetical protein
MQLKALTGIVSIALTLGVHALPNVVDWAAGVKDVLKRSHSRGIDISKRQALGTFAQQWLDEHNSAREKHGAAPLTWDHGLATVAGEWAHQCVWGPSGGYFGENWVSKTGSSITPKESVDMWMFEFGGYSWVDSSQ